MAKSLLETKRPIEEVVKHTKLPFEDVEALIIDVAIPLEMIEDLILVSNTISKQLI